MRVRSQHSTLRLVTLLFIGLENFVGELKSCLFQVPHEGLGIYVCSSRMLGRPTFAL